MDSIIKDMETRDLSTSDDILELSYEKRKWRVLLGDRMAIFLATRISEIYVQDRNLDLFTLKSRNGIAETVTITSPATKDRLLEMPEEHYEHYLAWKGISAS